MKILVLSSLAYSLINFRGDLLQAMIDNGHTVIAGAPDRDAETEGKLAKMGVTFAHTPMQRTGTNVISDMGLMLNYVSLIRREKPDIVLAYTQKPIIYGGIATRIASMAGAKPKFYALMSGLGQVFSMDAGYSSLLRKAVTRLYRSALARAQATFVFNADDRKDMIKLGIVDPHQRVIQVPGSGVSLTRFTPSPAVTQPIRFLMIGRLMRNKGIMEFLEASRIVHQTYPDCQFQIVGRAEDENPSGISSEESARLATEYDVEFVPGTNDVRPYLAASSVFVLPSYYREGLPRTILESLASARAVITTDLPGCRDAIEDGVNGFLVRPRNAQDLAEAMQKFAANPALAQEMGAASLKLAQEVYDVHKVNHQLLAEMGLLRGTGAQSPAATPTAAGASLSGTAG
ncbi:glycosyltransferase [Aurantiacibacter rhizosphaerae]|uniref:Glycosyltransferase n=1 Tax=Aurantiacibacter rhizosphaerae TaxID=2691582 RepID=A0A844XD17_9SPHN|nr:glycosyltransferase [Aurantiacibacter rhizosphaerae]